MNSSQNFIAATLEFIKKTRRSRTSFPEEWLSYSVENEDKSRASELAEEANSLEPSSSTPLNRKIIPSPSNASKETIPESTSFSIQKIPFEQTKQTLLSKEFALSSNSNSIEPQGEPTDTFYSVQWGLKDTEFGSNANAAWDLGITGSLSNVIGVIDTGIDYKHPDLYLNIWLNPGETPEGVIDINNDGLITFHDLNDSRNSSFAWDSDPEGEYGYGYVDAGDLFRNDIWMDGIDAESNGYIDDLIGWDFANNDFDPFDDDSHGTHVAGTIGALSNNQLGVAGVNWDVQLTALKFLGPNGGNTSDAIDAINYFTDAASRYDSINTNNGNARYLATNNSWGGGSYNQSLDSAIQRGAEQGVIFVAAAGNSARNNDVIATYPANYEAIYNNTDYVISVASIDENGNPSSFTNYGPTTTVDIAAPGGRIGSTSPNDGYIYLSGTSMAAPHVSGALGLLASKNSKATSSELIQALYSGADQDNNLRETSINGKRLNITGALEVLPTDNDIAPPTISISSSSSSVEVGSTALISFTLSEESSDFTADDISISNGSISEFSGSGSSYTAVFSPASSGETQASISVASNSFSDASGNFNQDGNETNNSLTLSITLPPPILSISANESAQPEGGSGDTTTFFFTVTRTGDTSSSSSAEYTVAGSGNNPVNSQDFIDTSFQSGVVNFAADEDTQIISIEVAGDSNFEQDETFSVSLSSPTNASISPSNASATATISNDDSPPQTSILFEETFEDSATWGNNWGLDPLTGWARSSRRATEGTWSGEVNGNVNNGSMTSLAIDLSGDYSTATMNFDWRIQRNLDNNEFVSVDISNNNGESWTQDLRTLRGNIDSENLWIQESLDLTSFIGSPEVLIRFRGTMNGQNERANVDNINISATSGIINGQLRGENSEDSQNTIDDLLEVVKPLPDPLS